MIDMPTLLARLDAGRISYELFEHAPVFNMAEARALERPYPEAEAKNLFVRDDKKRRYFLLTVQAEKHVDLQRFRVEHGLRRLSFASAEDLHALLGLIPGAVTPFGLLNDEVRRVEFFLDSDFLKHGALIGLHPNSNTATVFLKTEALVSFLASAGVRTSAARF